jgi:uncharacterized membrane protein YcaP (DUF421 family)
MEFDLYRLLALDTWTAAIALRGAALYLLLFALFHFALRNEVLSFGLVESLVLVLVADAAQNAMAGEPVSLAECVLVAAGMIACHFLIRAGRIARHRALRRLRRSHGFNSPLTERKHS